jgi:hypothetical protein
MMNTYRDILPGLGGYLTQKNSLHLPRVELFLQELARREPLYFQQRAMDEKEPAYAGLGYRDFYYQVRCSYDVTVCNARALFSELPYAVCAKADLDYILPASSSMSSSVPAPTRFIDFNSLLPS